MRRWKAPFRQTWEGCEAVVKTRSDPAITEFSRLNGHKFHPCTSRRDFCAACKSNDKVQYGGDEVDHHLGNSGSGRKEGKDAEENTEANSPN